jgi:hypothetical protein
VGNRGITLIFREEFPDSIHFEQLLVIFREFFPNHSKTFYKPSDTSLNGNNNPVYKKTAPK